MKESYGGTLPRLDLSSLPGTLIVIEGPDCAGRTTQGDLVSRWLEQKGYAVARTGLARSRLAGRSLRRAKTGNMLTQKTMSLFYATDFYDQLENTVIPALRSGLVVLADRWIYTLIARDVVRGADRDWVKRMYSMALVPQAVYYLDAPPRTLVERTLARYSRLNYWEAGMDLGSPGDWYEGFIGYQKRLRTEFSRLREEYGFERVNANRGAAAVFGELKEKIGAMLVNGGTR